MRVRDLMRTDVDTVRPDTSLVELERKAIELRVSGFPVVEDDVVVGVVSRSDVVRALNVERAYEAQQSDFAGQPNPDPIADSSARGARIGARIEGKKVADAMTRRVVSTGPDESVASAARTMVDKGIHRLPVIEKKVLVGIITSLDIAHAVAEGKLAPK